VGLNIYKRKIKVLIVNTEPVTLEGNATEEIEIFTNLGSTIYKQCGTDADIRATTGKMRTAFYSSKTSSAPKVLSLHMKLYLLNSNMKLVQWYVDT